LLEPQLGAPRSPFISNADPEFRDDDCSNVSPWYQDTVTVLAVPAPPTDES